MNFLSLLLTTLLFCSNSFAQVLDAELKDPIEKTFEQQKSERLLRIRNELVELRTQINELRSQLEQNNDLLAKINFDKKISRLRKEYLAKQNLFIETITNVNLSSVDTGAKKKTTFSEDIQQILSPILETFKKVSDKPREIQTLKESINAYQEKYEEILKAQNKLEVFKKENSQKKLDWKVKEAISFIKKKEDQIRIKLEDNQFRLRKLESGDESLVSTFSVLIFEFLSTKGKNLLVAFVVFIFFFWLFNIGKTKLISFVLSRINRSENREVYQWIVRPTRVIYSTVASIVALFLAILTLYVLNDWVLVTLILFLIVACIWSLKNYLPQFVEQSKIVLNLGTVREGERIFYNGVPWKVKSLGYYCRIINPQLSGGNIKISAKEIMGLNSRPINQTEPWFPTKCNDWVEVENVFGKVTMQSPEQVILKLIGGENKYYRTEEFYNMLPINLSQGFSIEFIFGLDYSHQKILLDQIIPNIKESVKNAIYEGFPEEREHLKDLSVDFVDAGASALNIRFFLKCSGSVAGQKFILKRFAQSEFVRACNKYDYIIPFDQLTVHMSK